MFVQFKVEDGEVRIIEHSPSRRRTVTLHRDYCTSTEQPPDDKPDTFTLINLPRSQFLYLYYNVFAYNEALKKALGRFQDPKIRILGKRVRSRQRKLLKTLQTITGQNIEEQLDATYQDYSGYAF